MYQPSSLEHHDLTKDQLYEDVRLQLGGLLAGETDRIANAANLSALLFDRLPDLNWAGFYFLNDSGDELVVGPFQGKPACVHCRRQRRVWQRC